MATLLLEIGVEELPASMVESASQQLLEGVCEAVREAGLGEADGATRYETPRRLIVFLPVVSPRQEGRQERRRGPSVAAAYKDGAATPALHGFARGAAVDVDSVEVEGDYVWANVSIAGKPASEALGEPLAAAVRAISFDKTMRWGAGRTRFSRPIRWMVALLDHEVIPYSIETVSSGALSRGHRFLSPEEFPINPSRFLEDLRERFVEPDTSARRELISTKSRELSPHAVMSDELLDENANLTEWPMPILGSFREEFLTLPKAVLVTAMAKHERFFPVESGGVVTTQFVSVTNGGEPDTVRAGNEWVLNARLNDALFFYEEDSRKTIEEFWEATDRIVFQDKLGTIKQRTERLAKLADRIATSWDAYTDDIDGSSMDLVIETLSNKYRSSMAREAGRLSKADLSTGLVSELPSLQGTVGAEYALKQGYPKPVCLAIAEHYAHSGNKLANAVMCADQADRLAGYLGIGEAPSGSSDPYALRKAATMLLRTESGDVLKWVRWATEEYHGQDFDLQAFEAALQDLLYGRFEALYPDIPYDVLAAAWRDGLGESAADFLNRARIVSNIASDIGFVRTAKRPGNIVEAARKKSLQIAVNVSSSLLEHEDERALFAAYGEFGLSFDLERYVANLRQLAPLINAYFDKVMVMVDDENVRANRLKLLSDVDGLFRHVADFSKIVIEED